MRQDLIHLLNGGVDGILFCNEDDRPYSFKADLEAVAVMSPGHHRAPTPGMSLLESISSGMPKRPLAVAKATGAAFIREVVTGVYESDMGLWAPDPAAIFRYRRRSTPRA